MLGYKERNRIGGRAHCRYMSNPSQQQETCVETGVYLMGVLLSSPLVLYFLVGRGC